MESKVAQKRDNTYCCVPQCKSMGSKSPQLSFHKFPNIKSVVRKATADGRMVFVNRKKEWINILKIEKEVSKRTVVCSKHFDLDAFILPPETCKRPRLKPFALPSLCLPKSSTYSEEKERINEKNCAKRSAHYEEINRKETSIKAKDSLMEKIKEEKNCYSSSDSDDEISKMSSERLRNKLTDQIEENKRLKAELKGYKDSQRTIEDLTSILRETQKILKETQEMLKEKKMPDDHRQIKKSTAETSKTTFEGKSVPCSSDSREEVLGTTDIPEKEDLCSNTVDLGHSVKVKRRALLRCCHKNYSKLIMDLMALVFTKDELANCSLTGKISNAHGGHVTKLKPALDALKVRAVIDYVKSKFPTVDEKALKTSMRQKLKYVSTKMYGVQYRKTAQNTTSTNLEFISDIVIETVTGNIKEETFV